MIQSIFKSVRILVEMFRLVNMSYSGMCSYPQVDLVLIRLVDMGFNRMFLDPHCRYTQGLQVDLGLIRLVVMGFNRMFLDPHCRYTQGLQVDLVLIRLMDMGFNRMFLDPQCRYTQGLQVDLVLIRFVCNHVINICLYCKSCPSTKFLVEN